MTVRSQTDVMFRMPTYLTAAGVDADVAADRVEHINRLCLAQLPRAGHKRVRLRGQRPHRAQVHNVARHLGLEHLHAKKHRMSTGTPSISFQRAQINRGESPLRCPNSTSEHMHEALTSRLSIDVICVYVHPLHPPVLHMRRPSERYLLSTQPPSTPQ